MTNINEATIISLIWTAKKLWQRRTLTIRVLSSRLAQHLTAPTLLSTGSYRWIKSASRTGFWFAHKMSMASTKVNPLCEIVWTTEQWVFKICTSSLPELTKVYHKEQVGAMEHKGGRHIWRTSYHILSEVSYTWECLWCTPILIYDFLKVRFLRYESFSTPPTLGLKLPHKWTAKSRSRSLLNASKYTPGPRLRGKESYAQGGPFSAGGRTVERLTS